MDQRRGAGYEMTASDHNSRGTVVTFILQMTAMSSSTNTG